MSDTVLSFRTRGGADPEGKAKVFFTCHPGDVDACFDRICGDILKAFDCAIYYTEDMTTDLEDENTKVVLERMGLFVIPVTLKLLTEPNRAMDKDYVFAQEKHIPVLPLLMENGIRDIYGRSDRFGELQYLSPSNTDSTKISYEEKLERYLESVLVSNDLVTRIKQAFDAYIFLSYRKTDRKLANDLMKMIHNNPECEDIAIWFDEFLTPGENFREGIDRILKESKLFALLVTPNLLKRNDNGTPNFIMAQEYPAAVNLGKTIFPAEMIYTDYEELIKEYPGLPVCADTNDEQGFNKQLLDALVGIAVSENNNDPEHNYLIGLAYLEGIDVEVDLDKGLKLITKAAEAGLIDAIRKLASMYKNGNKVNADYRKSLYWREKAYETIKSQLGEEHPDTLKAMDDLSEIYRLNGDYQKALEMSNSCYEMYCKVLGDKHYDTLVALNNLSNAYQAVGDDYSALETCKLIVDTLKIDRDETDEKVIKALYNLANRYSRLGKYNEAFEYYLKCYELLRDLFGDEHRDTLLGLNGLANAYGILCDYTKALELHQKCYELYVKVLGAEHPDTLRSMYNLALAYRLSGNVKKAHEIMMQCYDLSCKVLGEDHPLTLKTLTELAVVFDSMKDYQTAVKLLDICLERHCAVLGESHHETLHTRSRMIQTYRHMGDNQKAVEIAEINYKVSSDIIDNKHQNALNTMSELASCYLAAGETKKSLMMYADCLKYQREILGKDDSKTKKTSDLLADLIPKVKAKGKAHFDRGEYDKALPLFEGVQYACRVMYGEDSPETYESSGLLKKTKAALHIEDEKDNGGSTPMSEKTTGRKEYKDGRYYEGEMVDGKPEGQGTFYYNGGHWTGEFKNGMFNGRGKRYDDAKLPIPGLVFDNREYDMRTIHCGVWKDNKEDGRFVIYNAGVPYDQEYKNGVSVASPLHYEIPATSERPDSGSIKCYYCGQSGFIIETANETLVFDWYRAAIPPLEPSKPVYIFISHVHLDHYNSRIFGLADKYDVREIYLGLSGTSSEQGALDKIPQSMEDILCSFRGEQYLETDFGSVKSLKSTDMGVAFIVEAGGYRFFHAGDLFANAQLPFNTYKKRLEKRLSGMNGSGYSTGLSIESTARKFYPNEVTTSESQFKKYAAPLKDAGRIDYAMLPLDPRWDDFAFRTIDYYLSIADIKRFTPMHLWEKYDYVTDYIKHNPDTAGKIIAVNPDGCRMLQSIELNKPYFVKLK